MVILKELFLIRTEEKQKFIMYFNNPLKGPDFFKDEPRENGKVLVVRFPELKEASYPEVVTEVIKKHKLKTTSVNFFLSAAKHERDLIMSGEIIHSMIAFSEAGEPDMCSYLNIRSGDGAPLVYLELETPDMVFSSKSIFILEECVYTGKE
jgi:hypothetical protein